MVFFFRFILLSQLLAEFHKNKNGCTLTREKKSDDNENAKYMVQFFRDKFYYESINLQKSL